MQMKANYKTALLGGLTIGLVPAWLVNVLVNYVPALRPEELEIVSEFMSGEVGIIQILFFMIIVFIIPPLEELVFRGWLWKLVGWKMTPYWTWIIISLVFAAIHMEPVHILGLLPFSFFVGWLRHKTGELGPSITAHMANNAVACLLMVV
jgi:membrane protease YdiL (CAAX protease family)